VTLSYRRPGGSADRTATALREKYRPETVLGVSRHENNGWSYIADADRRIAHVRISALSRGTGDDLRAVIEGLLARDIRGMVLDLRWCPGGYLNEAIDVAGLFLGDELIATVKGRGREDSVYRGGSKVATRLPLVVLVNAETMGGAELVVAALQDHGRAKVVGQRTHGKASVQTPLPTGIEGVGFKLTTGTFVRPSGKNLHRFTESRPSDDWGVRPDVDCRVSPALSARLKADWVLWSLRPAESLERLALDDPTADAQRRAAFQLLGRMISGGERLSRRK
jgi:carboxyl-terminal processing protease